MEHGYRTFNSFIQKPPEWCTAVTVIVRFITKDPTSFQGLETKVGNSHVCLWILSYSFEKQACQTGLAAFLRKEKMS